MIKVLTIGVLVYLFYRLVFAPARGLNPANREQLKNHDEEDIIDVDYEDVE